MRVMSTSRAIMSIVALLALVATACAPAAPSPTAAPAAAPKPAATTAPAAPAATSAPAATTVAAPPTAAPKPAATQPREKFRVSMGNFVAGSLVPEFIARENGYFAEEGIDVEFIQMTGSAATAALLAGGLEISTSSGTAMNAILQGATIKVIGTVAEQSPYSVYTSKPEIKTLKDLEGKTYGVQDRGDTFHEAGLLAMRKGGVDAKKVTFVAVGGGAGRIQALVAKSVDATTLQKADLEELKKQPNITLTQLADGKTWQQHVGGLATTNSIIKDRRDALMRFLRGFAKGFLYVQKYPEKSADIWTNARELVSAKVSRDSLWAATRDYFVDTQPPANATHSLDAQRLILDVKKEMVPDLKGEPRLEDIFDFAPVQQAFKDVAASGWKP